MDRQNIKSDLEQLLSRVEYLADNFLGYPCTGSFDYSDVFPFMSYPLNNIGDPFKRTNYHLNTHDIEKEVLYWFAELTSAPKENFWGYVTNGGTEGNLYGLYLARELFPDGIVYYSQDTHYSISKNLRLLRMPNIMIRSQPNGEICYDDLRESIMIHADKPVILLANIGTTMKEAVDSVEYFVRICDKLDIARHYIHADAAMAGMTLPFQYNSRKWDFSVGVDSLSISGHKFIGSPLPCGIALAKKNNVDRIAQKIEYIGTLDTTVTGSRNAITPLILWLAINSIGRDGFTKRVRYCLKLARYTCNSLLEIGIDAWRNPHAITVVFERPPEHLIKKWQLAAQGKWAHLMIMPSVTRQRVDRFIGELKNAQITYAHGEANHEESAYFS